MQPSSLVFVAIVGLWAAYLLPRWIRRRDVLGASRSEDRHSLALRVLQRRRRDRRVGPSTAPLVPALLRTPSAPVPAPVSVRSASPTSAPARRRRIILATLLTVTVLAVGGLVTGAVPALVALIAGAMLAADVAALRAAVLRERRRRADRTTRTARAAARPARRMPEPVAAPAPVSEPKPVVEPEPVAPSAPVVAEARPDAGSWTPIPVPPPTYTLKPMAPRPEPAPLETPVLPAQPQVPAAAVARAWALQEPADVDLDDVLERRRAVNA